jgi:hypothetical protein
MDACKGAEDGNREEKGGRYEIYDRKSLNLLAEGELKEKDGKRVIERVVPDCKNAAVFVDGREMRMRLIANPPKQEVVSMDQIKEAYWTYGKSYTRLQDTRESKGDVFWQSKLYDDLNFHVVTEEGNNGKMVELALETEGGRKINLHKTVSENNVVFAKAFKK